MTQRIPQLVLNEITSAGTTEPVLLDYRFDQNPVHSIAGDIASGDTIILLVSPHPTSLASPLVDVWVTAATYTSTTFADVFQGSWPRVKITKTGTAGPATVYIV